MKAKIIKIGNSRGVRLPKSLLTELGIANDHDCEIQMKATNGSIVIKPAKMARSDWASKFAVMSTNRDDVLPDGDATLSSWDDEDWQWS